jgi:hypothetical protein
MEFLHMPKEFNGLNDWALHGLSYQVLHIGSWWGRVPTQVWEKIPGSEGGTGGGDPPERRCDLAQGIRHKQFTIHIEQDK